jgi:hypothetical protein
VVEVTGGTTAPSSALDLYKVFVRDGRIWLTPARRERIAILVEVILIASFVLIRSADLSRPWLIGWTALLSVVSVIAPASGLTALVAVTPYSEWLLFDRDTGVKILFPPLLGLGLLLRLAIIRPRLRPDLVTTLAIAVFVGTGLAVAMTASRFGTELGFRALVYWLAGLGGALIVLLVARQAARAGNLRPLIVATASIAVAALVSLVHFINPALVREGALNWIIRPTADVTRLTGIIPAPNAVAALFMAGAAVMVASLLAWRWPTQLDRWKWLLLGPIAWSGVAIWFTYSRSGVFGVFLLAVLYGTWWRRRVGLAILALGLVGAVVAVPLYLQYRAGVVGAGAISAAGGLLTQSDVERLATWGSAWRMWLDSPLFGSGTLAFKELHAAYGSPNISAPHNEVLRLMAEDGVVVAAAFVALCAAIGMHLWRARRAVALASLGAFVSLLAAASYNNPFGFAQVVIPVFAIVGCGLARTDPPGLIEPADNAMSSGTLQA